MPAGEGILAIRDADETQELGATTITGTVDDETGVISGGNLTTEPLFFQTVSPPPLNFPIDVTATFTQVAPNIGTGQVAATPPAVADPTQQPGQVTLRTSVNVDLKLDIYDEDRTRIILPAHCETGPVNLELTSTAPGSYTESEGGPIVDGNFTVPPVVANTSDCIAQVADGVNSLLAGPGHSLSLFIEGDLPVPPLKCETETTVSADPSDGSLRGTEVTLNAEVAESDPACADVDPTGTVVFRDGAQALGSAELQADGTASLTTTDLRPGARSLTAAYQGDSEFAPSRSAPLAYDVAPAPILTGTFPEFITRDAPPVEFDLTIDNVGSPRPIANARVDLILRGLNAGNVVLERQLPDDTWVPIPLGFNPGPGGGVRGTLGPDDGTVVPAGAEETVHMRVAAGGAAPIARWELDVELVSVDPGTGEDDPIVAATTWPFDIVLAARTATTAAINVYDQALRPGQQLYIDITVETNPGVAATSGQVESMLDGQVMPFRLIENYGPLPPLGTRAPIDLNGYVAVKVDIPTDISTGPHIVTARYLGNTSFLPSQSNQHVLPIQDSLSAPYTCDFVSITTVRTGAFVQASVKLPAYAKDGAELELEDLEVTVVLGGLDTPSFLGLVATGGGFGVNDIEIDLGDAGTADGTAVEYVPGDYPSSDQFLRFQGLDGSIVVDGEPGEVMPLPIEQITMTGIEYFIQSQFSFTCTPNDEPVVLDEVGVAGVSLVAETTTDPLRFGDAVKLTAAAAPAAAIGLIEFFAGSQSLGTTSGATGTATLTVDDLPVGANALTARYYGIGGGPYQSDVVTVEVRLAVECPAFAEEGTAATVRLVYLELLERCPDQAGFDYWIGRLDGGTSPSVFARSISRTPEAVGLVVEDAYQTMLGRAPEAAGRAYWVNKMRTGSGRYDQLLAELANSPEFWTLSGSTRAGFVTRVYERLLNRTPEPAGLEYWTDRLAAGASRRALVLSLANTPEPLGRLVNAAYDEILGRVPTGDEPSAGTSFLRGTGDRSGLYAQLIGTQEFVDRAQTFPNPED